MSLTHKASLRCLVITAVASFTANIEANTLFYSESGFGDTISKLAFTSDITTGVKSNLVFNRNSDPRAIAVDTLNNKIYYGNFGSISRANLDGSSEETIFTFASGGAGDIEIDAANGKLYFSNIFSGAAGIFSANTDGTGLATIHDATTLVATNPLDTTITTRDVGNISLDLDAGRLYWTADNGANGGRTALNSSLLAGGKATQHFVAANRSVAINKMDIDFDTSTVYYTVGSDTSAVRSSALDGSSISTLVSGLGRPGAIALDLTNDDLFFNVGDTLYQAGLDGTGLKSKSVGSSSLFNVTDLEYVVPEPASLTLVVLAGHLLARRRQR